MTVEQIAREIEKLSRADRVRLARAVIASLRTPEAIEEAWFEEDDRRYQAYLDGEVEAIPAAQAMAELRAELER